MREIPKEQEAKIKKNMTIFVIVVVILGLFISLDLILVTKADIGPFFAIPVKTYEDGGTKEYYGLGYKVIRYHQERGKRSTEVGPWWMPYSIEPTEISMLDFALEFRNYPKRMAKKYENQYLKITGEIKTVEPDDKKIILKYRDEDGSYSLEVTCSMLDSAKTLTHYKEGDSVQIVGTVSALSNIQKDKPMLVTLKNCFLVES